MTASAMRFSVISPILALGALLLLARPCMAQGTDAEGVHMHGHPPAGTSIGEVDFPTSCSANVQHQFNHAVWLLHSFWYEESLKAFTGITEAEPSCAMGYWGMAMSQWYPLWYPPTPSMLNSGADAVAKGLAVPPKTERERAYLEAIGRFFQDSDKLNHNARALAYAQAMNDLHQRYVEDREASVFYALALIATWPPTDKSYTNLRKAAAILGPVWAAEPDHPGVVHYLIHADDIPALAPNGLRAARRYAQIAPAVPHAQHMPSHIFTRLGLWQESIDSNLVSHRLALAEANETYGQGSYNQETVHSLDYLAYAYLQTAQDDAAKGVVEEILTLRKGPPANLPIAYAFAAIPARYALERRDWPAAAALVPANAEFPWGQFPWAAAITEFTRALGAAHTGDTVGAAHEIANLQNLKDKLVEAKNTYWANEVEVQRLGAAAVLAAVEGNRSQALGLSEAAVKLEGSMDKHPATPGAVLPAGELRGDLLLELNDGTAALLEYQAVLRTDPNRFRSVLGVARAAKLTGNSAQAKDAYRQLIALCPGAGSYRPELKEAQLFLAN